jgi:hypothetical protein
MKQGEEAIKRLTEIDSSAGMTGKLNKNRVIPGRELGVSPSSRSVPASVPGDSVLTDEVLASQRLEQAAKMKASAQQLLAEADRLMKEAMDLNPTTTKAPRKNAKKKAVEAH